MKNFFKILIAFLIFSILIFGAIYSYYQNKIYIYKILKLDIPSQSVNKVEVGEKANLKDFSELIKDSEKSLIRVFLDYELKSVGFLIDENTLVCSDIANGDLYLNDSQDRKYDIKNNLSNQDLSLSLIRIKEPLSEQNLLEKDNLKLGQDIYFVGLDKLGVKFVKRGIISSLKESRLLPDFEVKDALGGILFSTEGKIVAILNSKNEFVLVNQVLNIYENSKSKIERELKPGYLGIDFGMKNLKEYIKSGQPIGPQILGVVSSSPAEQIGLKKGDIVISINDSEMDSEESLEKFIKNSYSSDEVTVKVFRGSENIILKGKLGEKK